MGNNCCCRRKSKKKIVLLLVGLDNAGKTVAAKGLAGEPIDYVIPTVGSSVINLNYRDYIVKIFDLGGGPNIRGIWQEYFADVHGVIFVVDSSDVTRLNEAKDILKDLLSHEKICGKPVLLLANKQDSDEALDELDLIEKLDLETFVNNNECPTLVKSCAATTEKIDKNIKAGYLWLLHYITRVYSPLNERVEKDVMRQKQEEYRTRLEKIAKIRREKVEQDEDEIESYSDYKRKIEGDTTNLASHNNLNAKDDSMDRPKSAVNVIRKQLELVNGNKKIVISRVSNKITPLELYDFKADNKNFSNGDLKTKLKRSKSATFSRREYKMEKRRLRSANNENGAKLAVNQANFEMVVLPNMVIE